MEVVVVYETEVVVDVVVEVVVVVDVVVVVVSVGLMNSIILSSRFRIESRKQMPVYSSADAVDAIRTRMINAGNLMQHNRDVSYKNHAIINPQTRF